MGSTPKKGATATRRPRNLLIELGTEELPPKALKLLGQSLVESVFQFLLDSQVVSSGKEMYRFYASPRRLALWIKQVQPRQTDRIEERRGPSISAAFDQGGNPTKAALGFAGSCGVQVDQLDSHKSEKGEWLSYRSKVAGEDVQSLVGQALDHAVRKLPIPKRMRWGSYSQEFVRPVHWLLAMYGSDVLPVTVLGLESGCWTYGHRFHAPKKIRVRSADRYLETLKEDGHVLADYTERRSLIERQITRIAKREGFTAVMDQDLLDEVTGLVEWPTAIYGEFDRRFLSIPAEVLISSMRDHQKYFHLLNQEGVLVPGFVAVSNIKSSAPKRIKSGNQRVLRARLADAEFFWNGDQRIPLIDRKMVLDRVLFHKKLGSVRDKIERMRSLAQLIADKIGAEPRHVDRACDLCKADLVTDMVAEFPDLQGTIGSYYAANQGEHDAVSLAIREHYLPRFAGDALPQGSVSRCLALADRIDTLTGIFACGETPTGDKDPYALRRAALGVLRILIELELDLDLQELIVASLTLYAETESKVMDAGENTGSVVFEFIMDRLRAYYQPAGYDTLEITAVLGVRPTNPLDFHHRLEAVHEFFKEHSDAAHSLAAANKRIANILSKQVESLEDMLDPDLFSEEAESELFRQVERSGKRARSLFQNDQYSSGLVELASLKTAVDTFFDSVMVMDENIEKRRNRLILLNGIRKLFLEVADISLVRVD
ncbi:MAG: glycine--tRNA ligase subunit beta [bacterium]